MPSPLVVVVGSSEFITMWRACEVLAWRHGADGWSLGRGGVIFTRRGELVARYHSMVCEGRLYLRLQCGGG